MLSKLLPIILFVLGAGGGIAAGAFMRPPPVEVPEVAPKEKADKPVEEFGPDNPKPEMEYVKLNNQFVIPVVKGQTVVALVVIALNIEVPLGNKEAVFRREPKLRDSFLQVLFDHANVGGFDGEFTQASKLGVLRKALLEVAQKEMGAEIIKDVLIHEIARQDY